jgi:Arc/MetJ family transcription regulator
MRTNIEIDDKLMKQAMKASGAATKKAAVEEALQLLVKIKGQEGIRKFFGKVRWDGDLDWSRSKDKWRESEEREAAAKRETRKKAA